MKKAIEYLQIPTRLLHLPSTEYSPHLLPARSCVCSLLLDLKLVQASCGLLHGDCTSTEYSAPPYGEIGPSVPWVTARSLHEYYYSPIAMFASEYFADTIPQKWNPICSRFASQYFPGFRQILHRQADYEKASQGYLATRPPGNCQRRQLWEQTYIKPLFIQTHHSAEYFHFHFHFHFHFYFHCHFYHLSHPS